MAKQNIIGITLLNTTQPIRIINVYIPHSKIFKNIANETINSILQNSTQTCGDWNETPENLKFENLPQLSCT